MAQVDYDDRQWAVYDRARGVSADRERLWTGVLAKYVVPGSSILDLGSGTGAWSEILAKAFDATVMAVEPSDRMREVALREHAHPRVRHVAGAAERIPLPQSSCDAALLSNVLHHVEDRAACARELSRVLRPGGALLVRGSLRGARVPFLDYFPTAEPVADRQMDPADDVVALFAAAGFEHVATERVEQQIAAGLGEYYERIRLRGVSTLELIADEDFEQGLERMREAAEREAQPSPVREEIDLVVFRRV